MEIFFVIGGAAFLWLLSALAVVRLIRVLRRGESFGRVLFLAWTAALVAAMCLLFRPHEDIFGGEDPGSYINSGLTYGRKLAFFYTDPLLVQVSEDVRPQFYYGHSGYGATKDACLWVSDAEQAVIGPHFQPAYPLLISMASRLGGAFAGLYVVPLFTLLAGIALAALAKQCLPHRWSGISAFILYTLCPLVIWHGRCARPEIIASFFFFAGAALLLNAWNSKSRSNWRDIVLGTLCVGFAPFFHITAWLLVIPATFVILCAILCGRRDFIISPLTACLPAAAFIFQAARLTDYYKLLRFIPDQLRRPAPVLILTAACLVALAAISNMAWRVKAGRAEKPKPEIGATLGAVLAGVTIAFLLFCFHTRDSVGSLPILGRPIEHYLYLTDFRAYKNLLSRSISILVLAGWAAWLIGPSKARRVRSVLALSFLPSIVLAGPINDLMMTRYLLVAVIPVSALALAALASLTPARLAPLPALVALVISLIGLRGRTKFVAVTEHEGLVRFLKPFANEIASDNGILLCEYSRIAAPFEHFFGIPTLGIDNERMDDYSKHEEAWEKIMLADPERAAYFITPFQTPTSDRFDFALLRGSAFEDISLQPAYNNLPSRVNQGQIPLSLYRMKIRGGQPDAPPAGLPAVVTMEAGNMGLRRFANLRIRARQVKGVEWLAGEPIRLDFSDCPKFAAAREVLLLLMTDEPYPRAPEAERGLASEPVPADETEFLRLADEWWVFRISKKAWADRAVVSLTAGSPMFLTEAFMLTDSEPVSMMDRFPTERITERSMRPFKARWARADAEALIGMPPGDVGLLLVFFEAPDTGAGVPSQFGISCPLESNPVFQEIETRRWQWKARRLSFAEAERRVWVGLNTSPAWDSGLPGFPSDLGVLLGYLVMLPALN